MDGIVWLDTACGQEIGENIKEIKMVLTILLVLMLMLGLLTIMEG